MHARTHTHTHTHARARARHYYPQPDTLTHRWTHKHHSNLIRPLPLRVKSHRMVKNWFIGLSCPAEDWNCVSSSVGFVCQWAQPAPIGSAFIGQAFIGRAFIGQAFIGQATPHAEVNDQNRFVSPLWLNLPLIWYVNQLRQHTNWLIGHFYVGYSWLIGRFYVGYSLPPNGRTAF